MAEYSPMMQHYLATKKQYNDARVKSLKPRCACTGVVLWLNDPPRYEHKSGSQASQYANIWQDCRSTKYEKIRKAAFDLNILPIQAA